MGGEYQNDKTVITAVLHIEKQFGNHNRVIKNNDCDLTRNIVYKIFTSIKFQMYDFY